MSAHNKSASGVSPKWVKRNRRREKKKVSENNGQLRFHPPPTTGGVERRLDQKYSYSLTTFLLQVSPPCARKLSQQPLPQLPPLLLCVTNDVSQELFNMLTNLSI